MQPDPEVKRVIKDRGHLLKSKWRKQGVPPCGAVLWENEMKPQQAQLVEN